MPHSSHTQQTKTHEAAAGYSPRLCNDDLAPTRDQNWSWYNIFSFWMSDVHSMGGYVVAASFFTLGLASWQVLLCLLVGICIVQLCANLVAKPSQMAGVPYAVISRQAFGVFGANIPAVIRGLIAFAWYGIQTYLAANALMLVALKFWPSLSSLTTGAFLGLSHLGWICFAIMWVLQAMVFWHGMSAIKRFIDIAGPAVYVVMLALAGWIVYKTGFDGISFTLASKSLSAGEQTWQMITATALVVSYFSGPLLNFGDFSRYGKSMGEIRRGNRWGLPFNFLLFSIVTVVIVSGTQSLFGKMITDPIETVSRVGNDLAVAIGLLTMITATIGINIVANFVSPAFDFSNCSPQKISFRTGGMIAAAKDGALTADALKGKTVGVQLATSYFDAAKKIPGVKEVKTYKADPEVFSALKAKKIDAWISDKFTIMETLNKNADSGVVSGDQVFVEKVSLIMRKNNKEFMDKVNQALADLTADGTLAKISDKYFKTDITCK